MTPLGTAARPTETRAERLDAAAIDELRLEPGTSALLFLTDRCPVGCAHCSVDSRRDSPTITDRDAFARIVDGLCADPRIGVVGISGGEPFVERFGLELATRRLHEAGKRIVAYTSGVWAAADGRTPGWVGEVLRRCATVFLSTDAFHADGVPDARFVSAARAIGEAGAWIVVQVVDDGSGPARAAALLREAFGGDFSDHADLVPTAPLTAGRGQQVFLRPKPKPAASFGPCSRLASPMVRYDGTATACCNERVIMGHGPDRFRRSTDGPSGVVGAFDGFHADPLFQAIASVGPGALTLLPRFADLADERFDTICDLCWKLAERSGSEPTDDPVLAAAATLGANR